MSTALYRKYRSSTFAELVGQQHIVTTLRNEVRQGSLAQAYLFAGIRGTGKTSTARILARAVNCLDLRDGEPCNACSACVEILGGGAVDVLEIDAASNRGIDEMRDLREKVKFLPASLRTKVYIIDEAHMLTAEAWNAFLKTLEEPPPHVLFVLATTEPHKVPETVRSRVQRFDFRRVDTPAIAAHLVRVAGAEGVELEPPAVNLLARAGQGSVRDALSLMDQALATGERPLGEPAVRRALGLADPVAMRAMMAALASADAAATLRAAAALFDAGADARQVLREASRLARAAELCAVGYPEGADVSADDETTCRRLAAVAPAGFWVDAIDRFAEAEINLRQPVDARLQVELSLLHLLRRDAAVGSGSMPGDVERRLHDLETALRALVSGGPSAPPPSTGAPPPDVARPPGSPPGPEDVAPPAAPVMGRAAPTAPSDDVVAQVAGDDPLAQVVAAAAAAADARSLPAAASPPASPSSWQELWPVIVDAVARRDAMLAGVLRSCRAVDGGEGRLVVGAPFGFHLERLQEKVKARLLAEVVSQLAGTQTTVEAVFVGELERRSEPAPSAGDVDATQAALRAFPGSRVVGSRLRDTARDGGL